MKVIATDRCFDGISLREEDEEFEIPDNPSRKILDDDDEITKAAAKAGKIPLAFMSSCMVAKGDRRKRPSRKNVPEMTNVDQVIYSGGVPQSEDDESEDGSSLKMDVI